MVQKIIISALLLLSVNMYAQQNKNKIMINGSFNYSKQNSHNDFTPNNGGNYHDYISDGKVNLNAGYFLSNNFALGLKGSFERSINLHNTEDVNKTLFSRAQLTQNLYSSGLFARYNYMIFSDKLGVLFQLSSTYDWGTQIRHNLSYDNNGNSSTYDEHVNLSGISAGFQPGVIYFINTKFSIETSIGDLSYSLSKSSYKEEKTYFKTSRFNADFSMSTLYFGLTYYFGCKKTEERKSTE